MAWAAAPPATAWKSSTVCQLAADAGWATSASAVISGKNKFWSVKRVGEATQTRGAPGRRIDVRIVFITLFDLVFRVPTNVRQKGGEKDRGVKVFLRNQRILSLRDRFGHGLNRKNWPAPDRGLVT